MSGTIFAVFMFLLPGMDQPKVQRAQMPSYEACLKFVGNLLAQVEKNDNVDQKVIVACEVTSVKSDPA